MSLPRRNGTGNCLREGKHTTTTQKDNGFGGSSSLGGRPHATASKTQSSFTCEFCLKSFQRKYTLKRHLRSHMSNPERFRCEVCGRAYLHRYHLKRHAKCHEVSGIYRYDTPCDEQKYYHFLSSKVDGKHVLDSYITFLKFKRKILRRYFHDKAQSCCPFYFHAFHFHSISIKYNSTW